MKKRSYIAQENELINLTPLLDILFVVLVMFILIAPLIETDDITLTKVEHQEKPMQSKSAHPFSIFVKKNDQIFIHNKPVSFHELKSIATAHQLKSGNTSVELFCDQEAHFGIYQKIKIMMQNIGFKKLEVVIDHE